MSDMAVVPLKVLIGVFLAALLGCQIWLIPAFAHDTVLYAPEFAGLEVPGIVMAVALLVCVQIVLVCLWRLLSMVVADSIFGGSAFRWVDVILGAVLTAVALIVAGLVVIDRAQAGTPLLGVAGVLAVVAGLGVALVIVVLKGLLRKAVQLEHDLSEVV